MEDHFVDITNMIDIFQNLGHARLYAGLFAQDIQTRTDLKKGQHILGHKRIRSTRRATHCIAERVRRVKGSGVAR